MRSKSLIVCLFNRFCVVSSGGSDVTLETYTAALESDNSFAGSVATVEMIVPRHSRLKDVQSELPFEKFNLTLFSPHYFSFTADEIALENLQYTLDICDQLVVPMLESIDIESASRDRKLWSNAMSCVDQIRSVSTSTLCSTDTLLDTLRASNARIGLDFVESYLNLLDLDHGVQEDQHTLGTLLGVRLGGSLNLEDGHDVNNSTNGATSAEVSPELLKSLFDAVRQIAKVSRVVRQPLHMCFVRCSDVLASSLFDAPPPTPEEWWESSKFVNSGEKQWRSGRKAWTTQTVTHENMRPMPPPLPYEELVEGLATMRRTYELPTPVRLGDLVEVYLDVWDAQEGY